MYLEPVIFNPTSDLFSDLICGFLNTCGWQYWNSPDNLCNIYYLSVLKPNNMAEYNIYSSMNYSPVGKAISIYLLTDCLPWEYLS